MPMSVVHAAKPWMLVRSKVQHLQVAKRIVKNSSMDLAQNPNGNALH